MDLTDKAKKILRHHLWDENRKEDITPFIKALEKFGLTSFEKAENFFERFGGLFGKFSRINADGNRDRNDFDFRVKEVKLGAQYGQKPLKSDFQWISIGITEGAHMNIWINEKGNIALKYEEYEEYYNSVEAFFNHLFDKAIL